MPHHGKREEKHHEVRPDIHGSVCIVGVFDIDTVAVLFGLPVLRNWCAAEEQGDEIAGEIASDEYENGPSGISKVFVGAEEAEVHE